jgi:hypothetical protein
MKICDYLKTYMQILNIFVTNKQTSKYGKIVFVNFRPGYGGGYGGYGGGYGNGGYGGYGGYRYTYFVLI